MQRKFVLIILILGLTVQNFLKSTTSFLKDCSKVKIEANILKATCLNNDSSVQISIDLDQCIANFNGRLLWNDNPYGLFSKNCQSCSLCDSVMTCQCMRADLGSSVSASIDLKDGVENSSGELKCKNLS